MSALVYKLDAPAQKTIGLVVLQSDETIEQDFRRLMPREVQLHVSRVPSGLSVTRDSLQQMEGHLPQAAGLFPRDLRFDAVGYGCTSGTAQIGQARIAELVREGVQTPEVSEPVSALLAACGALGVRKLAILSPYIEEVSAVLRGVLAQNGVETPVFGSFEEAEEQKVARIAADSILDAGRILAAKGGVDALFLSCTNLRTFDVIGPLEQEIGIPVLSSNQVLGWHLAQQAGLTLPPNAFGRLLKS